MMVGHGRELAKMSGDQGGCGAVTRPDDQQDNILHQKEKKHLRCGKGHLAHTTTYTTTIRSQLAMISRPDLLHLG
jgi:hypothetical protein